MQNIISSRNVSGSWPSRFCILKWRFTILYLVGWKGLAGLATDSGVWQFLPIVWLKGIPGQWWRDRVWPPKRRILKSLDLAWALGGGRDGKAAGKCFRKPRQCRLTKVLCGFKFLPPPAAGWEIRAGPGRTQAGPDPGRAGPIPPAGRGKRPACAVRRGYRSVGADPSRLSTSRRWGILCLILSNV